MYVASPMRTFWRVHLNTLFKVSSKLADDSIDKKGSDQPVIKLEDNFFDGQQTIDVSFKKWQLCFFVFDSVCDYSNFWIRSLHGWGKKVNCLA
jgi:hypothetical protein